MKTDKRFIIHANTTNPKQGELLLSEPFLNDFHFGRSVVLLVEHDEEEGTLGVIMNKELDITVHQIVEKFPDCYMPVYLGGPVADDQLFFIHTLGPLIPDTFEIMDGLYWGGDSKTLETLISTGVAHADIVRFFLGYSGWDAGQLSDELSRNAWIVSPITTQKLLSTPYAKMWQNFVNDMGKDYEMWKRFPMNVEDN